MCVGNVIQTELRIGRESEKWNNIYQGVSFNVRKLEVKPEVENVLHLPSNMPALLLMQIQQT